MTITTEWLKERLKNPRSGTEFELITEVLANREAQPVAEPYMYELWKWDETVPELNRWFLVERSREKLVAGKGQKIVRLYTAPPAPANANPVALVDRRSTARGSICWQNGGKDLPHGTELFTAPPAPAAPTVPNEQVVIEQFKQWWSSKERGFTIINADLQKELQWEAWQDCRAAMLAQPVSSGYKLVPVEPTAEMIQSGIAAHYERQQLQIHDRPAEGPMECAYKAMLAAAPEGGNG